MQQKSQRESASEESLLRQEMAQLQHELRRVKDSLESSGNSPALEQRLRQLEENIRLCETELRQTLGKAADHGTT